MCAERVVSYVQYESCNTEQLEGVDLEIELLLKRHPLITRHSCTTAAQVEHPTQKGSALDGLPLLLRKQLIWAAGDTPHLMPVEQGLP